MDVDKITGHDRVLVKSGYQKSRDGNRGLRFAYYEMIMYSTALW